MQHEELWGQLHVLVSKMMTENPD